MNWNQLSTRGFFRNRTGSKVSRCYTKIPVRAPDVTEFPSRVTWRGNPLLTGWDCQRCSHTLVFCSLVHCFSLQGWLVICKPLSDWLWAAPRHKSAAAKPRPCRMWLLIAGRAVECLFTLTGLTYRCLFSKCKWLSTVLVRAAVICFPFQLPVTRRNRKDDAAVCWVAALSGRWPLAYIWALRKYE